MLVTCTAPGILCPNSRAEISNWGLMLVRYVVGTSGPVVAVLFCLSVLIHSHHRHGVLFIVLPTVEACHKCRDFGQIFGLVGT